MIFEPVAVEGSEEREPQAAAPPAVEVTEPAPPARRPGFWARLFGRKQLPGADAWRVVGDVSSEAHTREPEPEPAAERAPLIAELEAVVPQPAVEEAPRPVPAPEPLPEPEPDPGPPPAARLDDARAEAVLVEVLDTLGSAHHRPFSRG